MDKFKIGDRVTDGNVVGRVTKFYTTTYYWVEDETGTTDRIAEECLEYAKLSAEDAWLDVALMVGREVHDWLHGDTSGWYVLPDWEKKAIRCKACQVLGGNGLDCHANHDAFQARINGLIERALKHG